MTDETDTADIKLLDFGLGKIIGPGEKCTEPYGTLSYVAPEVLTEKPYGKKIDIWSVGVITYLMCVGCLPFDHESSEKEIARQTIHDSVPLHYSICKKLSKECLDFLENLLHKNPLKRLNIKEALLHDWIQKFSSPIKTNETKESSQFELFSIIPC